MKPKFVDKKGTAGEWLYIVAAILAAVLLMVLVIFNRQVAAWLRETFSFLGKIL